MALVNIVPDEVEAHEPQEVALRARAVDRPLMQASDAELSRRLRGGDADAMSEIVRRHAAPVAATIADAVGEPDGWEEVLQEVFLDLWIAPERFDPGSGNLRGHLCRRARVRSKDTQLRGGRRHEPARTESPERLPGPEVKVVAEGIPPETVKPPVGMVMDLARSVVRMVARQRMERILSGVAVAIASGKSVADCLVPAFDEFGTVMGASVVALCPRQSAFLIRRTGPSDPELERRLFFDARQVGSETFAATLDHPEETWAALHAPVELYGERTATLSVLRRSEEPFTKEERDVVSRLAGLVALAWASEQYQHQLAEIARLRERERIADALHDRVAQILYAAQLGLDTMVENASSEREAERMIEVRGLLTKGDNAIRDVIHQLTVAAPQPTLGRRVRIEIESVEEEFGVVVHVELPTDEALSVVPRPVADAVVKVAREGTVNAAKHAGPCRIVLKMEVTDCEVVMSIVDDGLGLRTRPGHRPGHGLASLRRQVADVCGTVSLSAPASGFGARLVASFPV